MTTRAFWSLLLAIGLFCLPGTSAAQDTASQAWLHVQISGGGHDDDDVHRHDDGDGHDDSNSRDDDGDEGHGDGERHDDDDGDEGHAGDEGDGDDGREDAGDEGHGDDGDEGHRDEDEGHNHGDEGHGDDDGDEEGDFNLNINVPLSAVEPLLSLVPHRILADGHLAVAGHDMPIDIGAMRNLWRAIANIGDAEFLSVDSGEERVRVARTGDQIHVQVEECDDDGGETVDIRLPVAVLDALLSGDGETLNIAAAVERLADVRGDIVQISSDERQIRVWIDELAHPGGE